MGNNNVIKMRGLKAAAATTLARLFTTTLSTDHYPNPNSFGKWKSWSICLYSQESRFPWASTCIQIIAERESSASLALREKTSTGELVMSTRQWSLILLPEVPKGWSRYITTTVISSWKWRLAPFCILFMSSYLISLFLAAACRAALTNRFAIPYWNEF